MDRNIDLRRLRLRMGWTSSDLARRLGVPLADIEVWENGDQAPGGEVLHRIEFLFRQAETCSSEVKAAPLAETFLEEGHLIQVQFAQMDLEIDDTPS